MKFIEELFNKKVFSLVMSRAHVKKTGTYIILRFELFTAPMQISKPISW